MKKMIQRGIKEIGFAGCVATSGRDQNEIKEDANGESLNKRVNRIRLI